MFLDEGSRGREREIKIANGRMGGRKGKIWRLIAIARAGAVVPARATGVVVAAVRVTHPGRSTTVRGGRVAGIATTIVIVATAAVFLTEVLAAETTERRPAASTTAGSAATTISSAAATTTTCIQVKKK
jgi:hypothetical protein